MEEVGREVLVDLRSAGGLDLIVGDKGEVIRHCRICFDVHPKSYGYILCRALQRASIVATREEEEEACVRGKGAREGAEAEARFGRSASSSPSPLKTTGEDL